MQKGMAIWPGSLQTYVGALKHAERNDNAGVNRAGMVTRVKEYGRRVRITVFLAPHPNLLLERSLAPCCSFSMLQPSSLLVIHLCVSYSVHKLVH